MSTSEQGASGPAEPSWLDQVNAEFQGQRKKFDFRYLCHDCCYLGDDLKCLQGFPNEMLLDAATDVVIERGQWTFCKYFELD